MDEALIKRVLPHSVEAEQAVIGSMLMDRDAILTSSEIISGDDFYQTAYGVIFEAVVEIYNEGKPVDLITLQTRLKEKNVPAEISSLEFVRDLVTAVPTSANVKYYAEIVAEKSMLRRLIKLNEEIENFKNKYKNGCNHFCSSCCGYGICGSSYSGFTVRCLSDRCRRRNYQRYIHRNRR